MAKPKPKTVHHKSIAFEPERVIFMTVVVSVLTLVLFGALTTL